MRLAAILLATLLLAGCATPRDAAPDAGAPASPEGEAWSFTSIEGETITSDSPERNATVLFFMATWCSSCRTKAPIIAGVAEDYAPRGVATYSLDFDATETADDLRAWQERYDQRWPHGIDEGLRLQRHFDVRSQSSVVVLDGDGRVVEHFGYGQVSDAGLRAALDAALAA